MSDIVVSPKWLADHLDDVRVIDVRDPWAFDDIGHLPGAVNVPFDRFRSAGDDHPGHLPGADAFADLLGEVGVEPDDALVAYDDARGVFAARFVVTALVYGHEDVHLLDGDYSSWSRAHETTDETPTVEPTDYRPREPAETPLVGREAVEAALDSDAVLVDTRDDREYEAGHLPGAVNLDWRDLVDDETRGLKPREELADVLADHGITPGERVVLYCNTARRISHTYVVLRHLGYEDVGFYEGSLSEWTEVGGPLETGKSP